MKWCGLIALIIINWFIMWNIYIVKECFAIFPWFKLTSFMEICLRFLSLHLEGLMCNFWIDKKKKKMFSKEGLSNGIGVFGRIFLCKKKKRRRNRGKETFSREGLFCKARCPLEVISNWSYGLRFCHKYN